jgi:hypothetical protein
VLEQRCEELVQRVDSGDAVAIQAGIVPVWEAGRDTDPAPLVAPVSAGLTTSLEVAGELGRRGQ